MEAVSEDMEAVSEAVSEDMEAVSEDMEAVSQAVSEDMEAVSEDMEAVSEECWVVSEEWEEEVTEEEWE